jgi:DNA-binding NarL/FixJ family response regulator
MIENSIIQSLPDMEIYRFKSIERAISQNKLNPDIIILDHFLEHTNGIDAIPVIKDFIQSASIVVLSSQTDPTLYSVAFQEGAKEYIIKDQDMYQNLVAFIRGEMEARNTSLPFWKTIFSDWLSSASDKIKNVAIVDDDESILLTLEHNLSQTSRIHVHTFISFNGFLTEYKLIPDVIILDYKVGKTLLTQEVIAQVKKKICQKYLSLFIY